MACQICFTSNVISLFPLCVCVPRLLPSWPLHCKLEVYSLVRIALRFTLCAFKLPFVSVSIITLTADGVLERVVLFHFWAADWTFRFHFWRFGQNSDVWSSGVIFIGGFIAVLAVTETSGNKFGNAWYRSSEERESFPVLSRLKFWIFVILSIYIVVHLLSPTSDMAC